MTPGRTEREPFAGGATMIFGALGVGVAGTIPTVWGLIAHPDRAYFSYLVAFNYALSIALGALALLFACHAMNAGWPVAVRRVIESIVDTLPLLAILYLPLLFGTAHLYPFMHPERVADFRARELLLHKHAYLNQPFFTGRAIFYLLTWSILALLVRRFSLALDRPGNTTAKHSLKVLSSAALPVLGLTLTFAAFDWLMALSPDFYSSMFGVYYFAGGFLAALALVIVLVAVLRADGWLSGLTRSHFYALGRLLLAFVVFWAYIAYFQFFLIWIGNKPIEAHWYLDRLTGGFRGVSWFLLIAHFVIPFLILLSYWMKQGAGRLAIVSVWLLACHYGDVHWLIAPARGGTAFSGFDFSALAMIAGFTIAYAVYRQRGHLLAPAGDPDYARALEYESQ